MSTGFINTKNRFSTFFALKFGADLFWVIYGLASFAGYQILISKDSSIDPAMMWIPFFVMLLGLTCLALNIYNYFSYLILEPEFIDLHLLFKSGKIAYSQIQKVSYKLGWIKLNTSEGIIILRIYKDPVKVVETIQKRINEQKECIK